MTASDLLANALARLAVLEAGIANVEEEGDTTLRDGLRLLLADVVDDIGNAQRELGFAKAVAS